MDEVQEYVKSKLLYIFVVSLYFLPVQKIWQYKVQNRH